MVIASLSKILTTLKNHIMKMNKQLFGALSLVVASALVFTACKKDSSGTASTSTSAQKLSVYLTDDPAVYDSVLIDIKYVEVKTDTSKAHKNDDHFGDNDIDKDDDHKGRDDFGKWDTLNIVSGVYNVSKLRNGIDTLMGTANINGAIRKIRITLGTNNSLNVAGVSYPLNLLPGINNYLYIKINEKHHHEMAAGQTALWIDFDISRSIIYANGQYYLKPVLRPFNDNNFARLKGKVLPFAATPLVSVYNATDTANGIPAPDGDFKIRGIKEGTYSILYKGFNGYRDTTISNIQLKNGEETVLPAVTLIK